MVKAQDDFVRVGRPADIELLLDSLIQPGGASLLLDKPESTPLPVVLMEQIPAESLIMDITAVREIGGELKRGLGFRLLGQVQGKIVRTPLLKMVESEAVDGRVICHCEYPLYLEEMQRREAYRARLRLGMEVGAILRGEGEATVQGDLKDLSQQGCQLELPASAVSLLSTGAAIEIELCFPNGTRFVVKAAVCHTVADTDRQTIRVGFRFEGCNAEQERKLWFFVREIERESSRYGEEADGGRLPSTMFQNQAVASAPVGRRNLLTYPTPMSRRLARVAGYLDAQLLELQQGDGVDSIQLSRHADMLLMLADEDMEALQFATRCLSREPWLVRHGLAVAVHILALADGSTVPRDVRKALAASAMVHDLGKGLVPGSLLSTTSLDAGGYHQLKTHVPLLMQALVRCQWLSAGVVKAGETVFNIIPDSVTMNGTVRSCRTGCFGATARLPINPCCAVAIRSRWSETAWADRPASVSAGTASSTSTRTLSPAAARSSRSGTSGPRAGQAAVTGSPACTSGSCGASASGVLQAAKASIRIASAPSQDGRAFGERRIFCCISASRPGPAGQWHRPESCGFWSNYAEGGVIFC